MNEGVKLRMIEKLRDLCDGRVNRKSICKGRPIDICNNDEMFRDFIYVNDLVRGIRLLIDAVPERPADPEDIPAQDSLSPVLPFRVVNIGNSEKMKLLDFTETIEDASGKKAIRNHMAMQKGDVAAIWADATILRKLTDYHPQTPVRERVAAFVDRYRDHYGA